MPKNKPQPTIASQEYKNFLQSLDLSWIALVKSQFASDRKEYLKSSVQNLSLKWGCEPLSVKSGYFELSADLDLRVISAKPSKMLLELSATYHLHLHASSPIHKRFIDRFADSEVRLVLWPYYREYISNVCGRLHVPPVFLPLLGKGE